MARNYTNVDESQTAPDESTTLQIRPRIFHEANGEQIPHPRTGESRISDRFSALNFGTQENNENNQRHAPEPVLYSRGNMKVPCAKPLLLQLFASVSLLNLSESVKCREAIIEQGGIHHIFLACEKVAKHTDLYFIIYYVQLGS